jgi:hypothetical protein
LLGGLHHADATPTLRAQGCLPRELRHPCDAHNVLTAVHTCKCTENPATMGCCPPHGCECLGPLAAKPGGSLRGSLSRYRCAQHAMPSPPLLQCLPRGVACWFTCTHVHAPDVPHGVPRLLTGCTTGRCPPRDTHIHPHIHIHTRARARCTCNACDVAWWSPSLSHCVKLLRCLNVLSTGNKPKA